MCDNSAIVGTISKTSIKGKAINSLPLILLTAALYDIEENWIADALSCFNMKRLANFQLDDLFNLLYHEDGAPLSRLKKELQSYYGTDLPYLQDPHILAYGITSNITVASTDTVKK